jgi:hypothetical protein
MFGNISNFSKTENYLGILNAILITDLIVIALLVFGYIPSKVLFQWYKKFNISAVIADVLIIFLGIILARYLYPFIFGKGDGKGDEKEKEFSLVHFIILAVCIQVSHDFLFYFLFSIFPKGSNKMLDIFKIYAEESGLKAIVADSFMMILACVLSSYFITLSLNANIIILIVTLYLFPYFIYSQ